MRASLSLFHVIYLGNSFLLLMTLSFACLPPRIWGGAIFEPRAFYDACDEFGVMSYHDMQIATAPRQEIDTYTPTDFALVKQELQYQIKRLSHHPSIAMWDGYE